MFLSARVFILMEFKFIRIIFHTLKMILSKIKLKFLFKECPTKGQDGKEEKGRIGKKSEKGKEINRKRSKE